MEKRINKCEHGVWGIRPDGRSRNCQLCFDTFEYDRNGRFIGTPRTHIPKPFDAKAAATINSVSNAEDRVYHHPSPTQDYYG